MRHFFFFDCSGAPLDPRVPAPHSSILDSLLRSLMAAADIHHPTTLTLSNLQEESASLLHTSLHDMTLVAHAKDAALASLAAKLHSALESSRANAEQLSVALDRNRVLEHELQESRRREKALEKRVSEVSRRLENAEVAEERLASQIGELEAESFARAVESNKLVGSLNVRLNEKEKLLEESQRVLQRLNNSGAPSGDNVEASKLSNYCQLLEEKLTGTESAWKASQLDLQELKKNFTTLQDQWKVAESIGRIFGRSDEDRLQLLLKLF